MFINKNVRGRKRGSIAKGKILFIRRPIKYVLFCFIITLIFLGEFIGLNGLSVAEQGEEGLFIYQGAAIAINSSDYSLTQNDYDKIYNTTYVTGINNREEMIALPQGNVHNVKEHLGEDPQIMSEQMISEGAEELLKEEFVDGVVLYAQMDTRLDNIFRWEKAVSLVEGEFPSYENKGILIESRFAKQNNLKVGDSCTFLMTEYGKQCTFSVCGIYKVESDLYIGKNIYLGEGIYHLSPYNKTYINYDYAVETTGLVLRKTEGCNIYVDQLNHVDGVVSELEHLFGDNALVENIVFLDVSDESATVKQMKGFSRMIVILATCIGGLLLLFIPIIFGKKNKKDYVTFFTSGYSKLKIILVHALSMLAVTALSLILASVLYRVTIDHVFAQNDKSINQSESLNTDETVSFYTTPDLNQPFSLDAYAGQLVTIHNVLIILVTVIYVIVLCLVSPVCNIIKLKEENTSKET